MKKAFSMIEMIFAIAVIGILAGIAIPKMMANKDTAHIVQLKEQVEAIRKGIEAYAGNTYVEKGFKEYPSILCSITSSTIDTTYPCKGAPAFADEVAKGINRRAKNSVGWDNNNNDLLFVTKPKENTAVFFKYDASDGSFKCDKSKVLSGWKAEDCSIIGE
ncbi:MULTISPECIES: type II secretion system protein [unclassified Campylobacter]|uniref:type II secretion system protein n=1 Tax=unclassified Campylobacter TaxID=2593542 RepID=UPI001BDA691D|nr:type II secretion system protein [Campylobacter sp. 2018MI01]MBT0879098.1 type II secretion system GspH family protein [Campylobacter sp. 2018MI01]MBZ7976804.1 type II secretion system protein [Campylobacter sp. RM12637]